MTVVPMVLEELPRRREKCCNPALSNPILANSRGTKPLQGRSEGGRHTRTGVAWSQVAIGDLTDKTLY